jgi:histidyl-tRNA synthetase
MTPTVSRMVAAKRQQLGYPLRWYSIPNLWRYERPQRGRLREHWQLNVDLFGVKDVNAEYEIITLVDAIFKAFNAREDMYEIRLNSRKLTDAALQDYLKLDAEERHAVAKLIDRMAKLSRGDFLSQVDGALSAKAKTASTAEKLLALLDTKELAELPPALRKHPSAVELEQLLARLQAAGIGNARFDIGIMRGFDYYTDIVFEVFDKHPDNNRSMLGGGRYDGLVGLFGVQPVPTVGFGWGDVTLANFLELHHLLPDLGSETDLYVVLAGDMAADAQKVVDELRAAGLNVAVDLSGRKLGDQIKTADKKGLRHVLVVGEDELKAGRFTLKDLRTGKEDKLTPEGIVQNLKS